MRLPAALLVVSSFLNPEEDPNYRITQQTLTISLRDLFVQKSTLSPLRPLDADAAVWHRLWY